jgi:nucleoside-diphosphate-sugar epimerase
MSTVLVTGASGFVGSHLVPALIDAGHDVLALVRDDAAATTVERRLTPGQRTSLSIRRGDVTEPDTLPAALEGADAIVHLAAIPRDWDGGATLRLVNTEGTRFLLAAAKAADVRRFVHLGALGVADEPDLHYGSSKAKAMALVRESGLAWTILSPSLLFGPRDGFFNILAGLVRMSPGVVPLTGNGQARFQPLAIEDLGRATVQVLADPTTEGRELLLGGPRHWTYREIVEEVLRGMGARRALVPMPVPLIRLVAGAAETVRIPFPVATDQLRQLRLDNTTDPDVVRRTLGWEPRPMEGGLTHLRRRVRDQEPAVSSVPASAARANA